MSERPLTKVWWRSACGELSLFAADQRAAGEKAGLTAELDGALAAGASAMRWCPDAAREGLAALVVADRAALRVRVEPGCEVEVPDGVTVTRWEADAALVSFAGRIGESWIAVRRGGRSERLALHVESPLLRGRDAHRVMIDDLLAESFALAIADEGPSETALVHCRDRGSALRVLVAWLLRSSTLRRALEVAVRSPLRTVSADRRVVPWASARRVRVEELASSPSFARGDDPSRVLIRASEPALSVDTPENRAVSSLLRVVSEVMADPEPTAALAEALGEVAAVAERAGIRDLPSRGAAATLAASRHPGYRELSAMRAWLEGLAVATDPYDPAVRLALDDSALLYERWCVLEVSRALGLDATVTPGGSEACSVDGSAGRLWSQPGAAAVRSYGLAYRPDLVLEVGDVRLVFDAKFRADVPGAVEKMHAYRDAISGCVGAWALMPCDDGEAVDHAALGGGGVGVVALRPERGEAVERRRRGLRERVRAVVADVRRRSRGPAARPG